MKVTWKFIDSSHLQETHSGFMIKLTKGTWFHPQDYQSIPPDNMDAFEQALMVQSGMDHIASLSEPNKVEYI